MADSTASVVHPACARRAVLFATIDGQFHLVGRECIRAVQNQIICIAFYCIENSMIWILCNAVAARVKTAASIIHEHHDECVSILGRLDTDGRVAVCNEFVYQLIALAEFDSVHCILTGIVIERVCGRWTDNAEAL